MNFFIIIDTRELLHIIFVGFKERQARDGFGCLLRHTESFPPLQLCSRTRTNQVHILQGICITKINGIRKKSEREEGEEEVIPWRNKFVETFDDIDSAGHEVRRVHEKLVDVGSIVDTALIDKSL